jgi:hypothetical protein
MQLVMRRNRLTGNEWHKFKINARMVLNEDEKSLLARYVLQDVILTPGNVRRDARRAVLISAGLSLLLYGILRIGAGFPPLIAVLIFPFLAYLIYHQIREEVRVKDLLDGRDFKARSLLQLLQKEYAIRKMSAVFSTVVSQARTWHEPEVIELEPQPLFALLESDREAA